MSRQSRVLTLCVLAGIACFTLIGSALAADWQNYLVVGSIDSNNYDLALSEGKAHVVYENAGNVYYTYATADDTTWHTQLIGAGGNPSIATTDAGEAYVVYSNAGTIYEATSSSNWTSSAIGSGSVATIDLAGGVRQVLIEGNFDGDGYAEIAHASNSGSGWSSPEVIQDGWYYDHQGNYFGQSSITALENGGYAYALESQGWYGNATDSQKYPSLVIPGVDGVNMGVGYNTGSQLTRNAVCSGNNSIGYAFSTGGSVYQNAYTGGAWTGFTNLGAGSDASCATGGVAFVRDGKLMFWDGNTVNSVSYQGLDLTGSMPVLWADHDQFMLFKDNTGNLAFTFNINPSSPSVPEPGSMAALASGLVGLTVTMFKRRRK